MNNQFAYTKSSNAAAAADKGGSLKMTLARLEVRIYLCDSLGYD
jgi:hypothetical protein